LLSETVYLWQHTHKIADCSVLQGTICRKWHTTGATEAEASVFLSRLLVVSRKHCSELAIDIRLSASRSAWFHYRRFGDLQSSHSGHALADTTLARPLSAPHQTFRSTPDSN